MRPLFRPLALLFVLTVGTPFVLAEPPKPKLQSNDPTEVFRAIQTLAAAKDLATAPAILQAGFTTAHAHIAVAAGEALAAIGADSLTQLELAAALDKVHEVKDDASQRNLARILGAWGRPCVDEILGQLASGHRTPEVQAEALFMCGRLFPTAEFGFPHVIQSVALALDHGRTETIRMAACSAAARLRSETFVAPLDEIVRRSQDPYTGLMAVWALRRMGQRGKIHRFVRVLEAGTKAETARGCLKAITELSTLDDIDDLLSLTRSGKKDFRDAACLALDDMAQTGLLAAPVTTGDPQAPVTVTAPSRVVERLLQIVEADDSWEVRDAASRTLIRLGPLSRPQLVAKVPSLIGASDEDVALTAMELCGRFGVKEAYAPLYEMAHLDQNPVKRMFASRALGDVDGDRAAADIVSGLSKDKKSKEALRLVRTLGYVRSEKAYEALISMLTDAEYPEEMLREAEFALERLTGHRFGRKPERWRAWYDRRKGRDPFRPHIAPFDRTKNRKAAIERKLFGVTEGTENSVEAGLRWLEAQQHPEGCWDGNEKGFGGIPSGQPCYTGSALLAFLGAGYSGTPGTRYCETVRRGAEFLAATQFYDGGFPVTGGGDASWVFAYFIGLAVWGLNEAYGLSADEVLRRPAQRGIDYLVRVQTPGAGWRYGPRYSESDTSATSWVLMALKSGNMLGLDVAQKAFDGIDAWLETCSSDVTGLEEMPEDLMTAYDQEVGVKRYFRAFTSYQPIGAKSTTGKRIVSMTAVAMVCRFFLGWKRSHPFLIGSANLMTDNLPVWMKGGQVPVYSYFWYYGTVGMHQMGGRYWRAWNEKIKSMLPEHQLGGPPETAGSWDEANRLGGGKIFVTSLMIMALETYYRFSPLLESDDEPVKKGAGGAAPVPVPGKPGDPPPGK